MKKQEMAEIQYCDVCGKKVGYVHACLGCGKEVCFDCRKSHMVEYPPGVYFSGADGYFCNECNSNPPGKVKIIHAAFKNIASLRVEETAWRVNFQKRCDAAEAYLKELREN